MSATCPQVSSRLRQRGILAAGAISSLRAQELGLNAAASKQAAAMGRCPNSTQATRCTPYVRGIAALKQPAPVICFDDAATVQHIVVSTGTCITPRPCKPAWSSHQDSINCRMRIQMRIKLPASTRHARTGNRCLLSASAMRTDQIRPPGCATAACSMQHAVNTLSANNSSMQMFTYIPAVHAEPWPIRTAASHWTGRHTESCVLARSSPG